MTMAHAITTIQKITDGPSGKLWCDGQRNAWIMIPATTSAAELWVRSSLRWMGNIGMAFQVSTPNVLVIDLTCHLKKAAKYDDIKKVPKQALENSLKGMPSSTEDQVIAFNNDTYSSTFKAWGWHCSQLMLCQTHFLVWQWIWQQQQGGGPYGPRGLQGVKPPGPPAPAKAWGEERGSRLLGSLRPNSMPQHTEKLLSLIRFSSQIPEEGEGLREPYFVMYHQ